MRASLSIGAALLCLLTMRAGAASAQDHQAQRARVEGAWLLSGPVGRADAARDAAVERVVEQMSFFVRSIARGRLRQGSPIDRRIELRFLDGDRLRVRFGGRSTYTTGVGRTERRRRSDGTPIRVTQRFRRDGALEQVFETDSGSRYFIYHPTDAGLRVEIITTSDRLPAAVRYELSYRRG